MTRLWKWLVLDWEWPAAALFAAGFLLLTVPLVWSLGGPAPALVLAQLPIYMIHQYEEHTDDRFRRFVNRVIGGGREALTPAATFWINSLGVWGIDALAVSLSWIISPAAALVAGYLSLLNGLLHLIPGIVRRAYNPGLVSGILLLIPIGLWCVLEAGRNATVLAHATGLVAAIVLHALIVLHVLHRVRQLSAASAESRATLASQPV